MKLTSLTVIVLGLGLGLSTAGCGQGRSQGEVIRYTGAHADRTADAGDGDVDVAPEGNGSVADAGDEVVTPSGTSGSGTGSTTPVDSPSTGGSGTSGGSGTGVVDIGTPPRLEDVPEGRTPVGGSVPDGGAINPADALLVPVAVAEEAGRGSVTGSNGVSLYPGIVDAGLAIDYILRSTGTVNVVNRDASGRLHLCQGTSKPEKWIASLPADASTTHHRCIELPTEGTVKEQANLLFESGAGGGKIHIFAHSTNNDYIAHTVCPAVNPTAADCRAEILPYRMKESPSSVILADGTIYVFFQNEGDGRIAFVRRAGGQESFAPARRVIDELSNPAESDWAFCGPIWATPSAFVQIDDNGNEIVHVTARDNDLFYGHIRLATLRTPLGATPAERGWSCRTFNNSRGQDDTASMTLGSTPAAFFNAWTGKIQIFGKEHNGNHIAQWATRIRGDGSVGLEPSRSVSSWGTEFPWTQAPSLVVDKNGMPGGSYHAAFRTSGGRFGERMIAHVFNNAPENGGVDIEFIGATDIADGTPGITMDPAGNLHVFAARQVTGRGWIPSMYHFFKAKGAAQWTSDYVEMPIAGDNNSPAVLFTPNMFRL